MVSGVAAERASANLVEIIEKQFPRTADEYQEDIYGFSKRSEFLTARFDASFRTPLIAFGLGPDEEAWKRVRKAAIELRRAIDALGYDGLTEINWQAPMWWDRKNFPLGHETAYVAEVAADAAGRMIKKRETGAKASKKRDWRSAALAKTARRIWAEEEWRADPTRPPLSSTR